MELCYTGAAPMCIVHPNKQIWVGYGFSDASSLGLGSSFTTIGACECKSEFGDEMQRTSLQAGEN